MSRLLDAPARWLIGALIRRGVRRAFRAVLLCGRENLPPPDSSVSLLLLVNHTNWWDGFVAHVLTHSRLPHHTGWLLQEAGQWRNSPFFRAVGALPLDAERPLSALRRATQLLNTPGQAVWFFPQGRVCQPTTPIHALPGAGFLAAHAAKASALVIPVNFRYEWLVESRATVLIHIGKPMSPDFDRRSHVRIGAMMQALHNEAGNKLEPIALSSFQPIYRPRLSLNKRWEWFVAILTGRLKAFHAENRQ